MSRNPRREHQHERSQRDSPQWETTATKRTPTTVAGVWRLVYTLSPGKSRPEILAERGDESHMDKTLLSIMIWVFLFGGLFGFAMGMSKFFSGGTPAEYGVMGIGGGFWLLSSAITIHIRNRLQ